MRYSTPAVAATSTAEHISATRSRPSNAARQSVAVRRGSRSKAIRWATRRRLVRSRVRSPWVPRARRAATLVSDRPSPSSGTWVSARSSRSCLTRASLRRTWTRRVSDRLIRRWRASSRAVRWRRAMAWCRLRCPPCARNRETSRCSKVRSLFNRLANPLQNSTAQISLWNQLPDAIAIDASVRSKNALHTVNFEAALTFNRHF